MANVWNGPVRPSAMKKGLMKKAIKPEVSGMFTSRAPSVPTKRGPAPGLMQARAAAKQDRSDSLPKPTKRGSR